MYDVIQLRNSSLSNTLLIKRSQWNSVTGDINSLTTLQLQNAARQLAAGQPTQEQVIHRLLKNITSIGIQVPGSFSRNSRCVPRSAAYLFVRACLPFG
jgi:hypothetical protein